MVDGPRPTSRPSAEAGAPGLIGRYGGGWLVGIVIGLSALLLAMPLLRYRALRTGFFDLGQYVTNYWTVAFDGLWITAANTHLHLPMLVFAPIFRLAPSPATLLVLQSATLIAGLLIYVRLWTTLGAGPAWLGAAIYGLSLPVWFSALADYHFEHLLFPLYALYVLALVRRERTPAWVLVALALAICGVKEIYGLTAAMLGLVTAAMPGRRRIGIAIFVMSLLYFYLASSVVIPRFTDGRPVGELWGGAFGYLGRTPVEMVLTLLTRPWIVLSSGNIVRKIVFVAALVLPFAYLVRGPFVWLLPTLPPLAIAILSRSEAHSYLGHQYTVPIAVAVMTAAAVSLSRMPPASRVLYAKLSLLGTVAVLVLFGPSPISRLFFSPAAWNYQAAAYWPGERDRRIRDLIDAHIPADPSIVVSMQSSVHTGRLSKRTHPVPFPSGVKEPARVMREAAMITHARDQRIAPDGRSYAALAELGLVMADFVVVDARRPWMIVDRYCMWSAASACTEPDLRRLYLEETGRLAGPFERIVEHDGFEIWRRKS